MSHEHERALMRMEVCVAPFAVHEGALVLAAIERAGQELALPNALVHPDTVDSANTVPFDTLARGIVRAIAPCAPLEPLVWQTGLTTTGERCKIGYATVMSLVNLMPDSHVKPLDLEELATNSTLLSALDAQHAMAGLHSLRSPNRYSLTAAAMIEARENTPLILARLLSDPRKFTLTELQQVVEALQFGKPDPDQYRGRLDNRDFRRKVRALLDIRSTDEWSYATGGRPAQFWTMPDAVLEGRQ